jgi:hypothetical protein
MTTIQWFEPQAYKTLSNSHGMEIMINNSGDEVSYKTYTIYSEDGSNTEVHTSEILYDQEGDSYFREWHLNNSSTVHYLNEFMKIK